MDWRAWRPSDVLDMTPEELELTADQIKDAIEARKNMQAVAMWGEGK